MHAGEPDLPEPSFGKLPLLLGELVPQERVERVPLVVERKRVAGVADLLAQLVIRHRKGPDPLVDAARQLGEGSAIGGDRIPCPDEADLLDGLLPDLVVSHLMAGAAPQVDDAVASLAQHVDEPDRHLAGMLLGLLHAPLLRLLRSLQRQLVAVAIGAIGVADVAIELLLGQVAQHALVGDEPGQDPDREGAPAEAEDVDGVAGLVILAKEPVEGGDVALEPDPEDAAQDRERLEGRGADAVVVMGDLPDRTLRRLAEIERLVEPPNIRPEELARAVAGPIRKQDDVLCHRDPPRATSAGDHATRTRSLQPKSFSRRIGGRRPT
jgi:hypothetical protein